jgi:hypothetical protein
MAKRPATPATPLALARLAAAKARYQAAERTVKGDLWQHKRSERLVHILRHVAPASVRIWYVDSGREAVREIGSLARDFERVQSTGGKHG